MRHPALGNAFLFQNAKDIDDAVKCALAESWSICSTYALTLLLKGANDDKSDDERKERCMSWINALVPFILAGLRHSEDAEEGQLEQSTQVPEWASSIKVSSVRVDCLRAMGVLVTTCPPQAFHSAWNVKIKQSTGQS